MNATLKESPHEVTQRVSLIEDNGTERGPFIRKFIHRDSGMGAAYERIFDAQQQGRSFRHIPEIVECYRRDEHLVVIMEFIEGETLQARVYRLDPSVQLARDVFPQTCEAVTELHESFDPPLIHRDLKPSNVMLSARGLTIIDFGITREFKEGADADTTKFGTRAFAPPEQFGFGQTTVRSDVYALGMLLYYCLTEKIPTAQIRDEGFIGTSIPDSLRPVLVRATALDPNERYGSATELKKAFLEAAPRLAADSTPNKHRRALAVAAAGVAVIALASAGIIVALGGPAQSDNQASTPTDSAQESYTSSSSQVADAEAVKEEILDGTRYAAPLRNGFDPTTNIDVTIAGVTFQIPSCFGARIQQGDGATFYYAESGSTLAMIMSSETQIDSQDDDAVDGFKNAKDSYLVGMVQSNEELFNEIVSATDFVLAGQSARIVTVTGTQKGLPVTTKAVYFINPDQETGVNAIGSLIFGQTDNAQFDYFEDFAKTIASATPANQT